MFDDKNYALRDISFERYFRQCIDIDDDMFVFNQYRNVKLSNDCPIFFPDYILLHLIELILQLKDRGKVWEGGLALNKSI